jgi:methyl-accepting chemotaxis protein
MNEKRTLLSPPTMNTIPASRLERDGLQEEFKVTGDRLMEERRRARLLAKQQQLSERLVTAAEELSSGMNESQSAIYQLQKSLEQMEAGAVMSNSSCMESAGAVSKIMESVSAIADTAAASMNRSLTVQQLLAVSSNDISRLVDGVASSAEKSSSSARLIMELEEQAKEIGTIIGTVVNLADQTNLLALNAAIEAARAGEHGSGFAVVADEVRMLAETAERSAKEIRQVVTYIQTDVSAISLAIKEAEQMALAEIKNGNEINDMLMRISTMTHNIVESSKRMNQSMHALAPSVHEFEGGTRIIARSADDQAQAAGQALSAINEQMKALHEINQSAMELSEMASDLRGSRDLGRTADILSSSADQLSASIAQSSQSAREIMTAIDLISSSADMQSTATEQSRGAIILLERAMSEVAEQCVRSEQELKEILHIHTSTKERSAQLIENIGHTLDIIGRNLELLLQLEVRIRQINKIVNTIDKVGIQTNMLAVNGAIEAAGAGKFGRGFAVVASDIRSLALETAVNAENIKDLVFNIQNQVMMVVRDLMSTRDSTRNEVDKARRITTEFNKFDEELEALIQGVVNNNRKISESRTAVSGSNRAIEQIADAAAEAAIASKQASIAGQEQNIALSQLSSAIEEIAMMADDLLL